MSAIITDFESVLTTTRSVRKRLDFDRPVTRAVIDECMEIALQAPTGGNAQDWRFLVIDDVPLKVSIGNLYLANFNKYVREPLLEAGGEHSIVKGRLGGVTRDGGLDERTKRMLDGATYLAENIHRSPWMVIACGTRPNADRGGSGTTSALYGSVYPAVWSFQLALRSRGLGSVITSLHLHSEAEVGELLGIPENATQVALLPVAYTKGLDFRRGARRPVSEVVFHNRWDSGIDQ
jgi:nitroreductase